MIFAMNYAVGRVASRLRIEYFRKSLEKDAAYYDLNNPTEVATQISKNIAAIKAGLGQKYGHVL